MANNQEKDKSDWSKREIGALWKKTNGSQSFYSGKIKLNGEEIEIVCFSNKHKTEDRHPDIRVYISESKK